MHPHFSLSTLWSPHRYTAGGRGPGPSADRIATILRELRHAHRAIRIIDLDCGDGMRLIAAAGTARALGFVAVEGLGSSTSAAEIRHARREAASIEDAGVSLTFVTGDPIGTLAAEHDGAADLILLSEPMSYPASPLRAAIDRVCAGIVLAGS